MSEVIDVAEAYDRVRTLFMGVELLVAPGGRYRIARRERAEKLRFRRLGLGY
jgi:hypothetical protein